MDVVLHAEALTKTYQMGEVEVRALRGIDLALRAGELVVLLGASGSGKSTLLNLLGGLDVPSTGHIFYRDRDLTTARERARTAYRRDHVGFVFQLHNLVSSLTARENVAIVTDLAEHPLRPEQALELVGLSHRLDHFPAQLSGGERDAHAHAQARLARRHRHRARRRSSGPGYRSAEG
jgi:putative ABC transport system ATP-binding protein